MADEPTALAPPAASGAQDGDHATYQVRSHEERFRGRVFGVYADEVVMPDGGTAVREYVTHVGAVGAVTLDLTSAPGGRVMLVRQYRHPVGHAMWELPAGLTDVAGEPAVEAAKRELAEEADLVADRWDLLLDMHPSPGCSTERIRIFLARDLSAVPQRDRHVRTEEEAEMTAAWFDLDEAIAMGLAGHITNAACLAGLLAAARARDSGWATLRPVD